MDGAPKVYRKSQKARTTKACAACRKATKNIPRGLKFHAFYCTYGTAEAVPFQNLAFSRSL
jgi:hypothetical protein